MTFRMQRARSAETYELHRRALTRPDTGIHTMPASQRPLALDFSVPTVLFNTLDALLPRTRPVNPAAMIALRVARARWAYSGLKYSIDVANFHLGAAAEKESELQTAAAADILRHGIGLLPAHSRIEAARSAAPVHFMLKRRAAEVAGLRSEMERRLDLLGAARKR